MKSLVKKEYGSVVEKLILARKKAGITQQQLASILNKPQSFVSKFENKERRLDIVEFIYIAHSLSLNSPKIVKEINEKLHNKSSKKSGDNK